MARFDLYSNPSAKSKAKSPYLLDIQSNHLGDLHSRVVVPLTRVLGSYTPTTIARDLSPVFQIQGEEFLLETPLLGALRIALLGPAVGSLKSEQVRILSALDRLFGGY